MCASDKLRVLAAAAAIVLAGCSDDVVKTPDPNDAPDTFITSDTPRPHEESSYQVKINWNGSDPDGRITGYYFAWDDTVDAAGNLTWHFTASSESTFVVSADSCSSPPCQGVVRPFFDYHTFWVKSVDDLGAHDPTPAFRTFTATTIAPEVTITIGPFSVCAGGVCDLNSDYVFVEWRGNDPDGQIAGYWYKWNPDSLREYPTLHGPDPTLSGWTYLRPESTSVASRQQQLNPPGCSPKANSFAVYAVDDAGAIQQVGQCGVNWTCFCPDSTRGGPGLCIDGGILGARSTPSKFCDPLTGDVGAYDLNRFAFEVVTGVFKGTPVGFKWIRLKPEAGRTPAPLVGYRYAIDDPTGFSTLSKTRVSLADSIYAVGSHTLYLEAVDRAGIVDPGRLQWVVSAGPKYGTTPVPKRVLIVDDNGHTGDVYYSEWREVQARERANWDSLLTGFRYDYWDTQEHVSAPQVPTVGEYTTVIWNTGIPTAASPTITSFLRDQLFKPRAEYLSSYVRAGGNIIIVGMNPMFCMVIRSPGVEGGDLCEQPPAKGIWMFWDPTLCGQDPDEAFPHFLFTRLGIRQMKVPQAEYPEASEEIADRMVRGCTPVNPSGTFNRYLGVDSLRAGGDTPPHLHNVPAANVTIASSLESWSTAIYYMDTADTTAFQNILGIVAIGDQNPRKPASDPSWGNTTFLSVNPYFLKVDDARWFFRTLLTEVCAEEYNP